MKNFMPKPYKKEPITIRIDTDRLQEIDVYCVEYGTNRSEFIRRCIEYALQNISYDKKETAIFDTTLPSEE